MGHNKNLVFAQMQCFQRSWITYCHLSTKEKSSATMNAEERQHLLASLGSRPVPMINPSDSEEYICIAERELIPPTKTPVTWSCIILMHQGQHSSLILAADLPNSSVEVFHITYYQIPYLEILHTEPGPNRCSATETWPQHTQFTAQYFSLEMQKGMGRKSFRFDIKAGSLGRNSSKALPKGSSSAAWIRMVVNWLLGLATLQVFSKKQWLKLSK